MSFPQSEFCVAFRIFVCLSKRSTFTLKLNKLSRLKMVTKQFEEIVIFHQNFWQEGAIELKFW